MVENAALRIDLKGPARRSFLCINMRLWASFFPSWARIWCRLFRWSSTSFSTAIATGSSRRCRASWMCLFNNGAALVIRSSSSIGPVEGLSASSPRSSKDRVSIVDKSTTANTCKHTDRLRDARRERLCEQLITSATDSIVADRPRALARQ